VKHRDSERTWDDKDTIKNWWKRYIGSHILRHKPTLYAQFISNGDLCFDIGASRGGMTWAMRQNGAKVISVEPLQAAMPRLVQEFNWMFDDDPDVTLVAAAVSPDGQVDIAVNLNQPYLSSCSVRWRTKSIHAKMYGNVRVKRIEGVTLDYLIEFYGMPRFIKVDCEGYNGEVISTLHHPVHWLSMEFHKDWLWNNNKAIKHLATVGEYEYNYCLDNRGQFELDEWMAGGELLEYLREVLLERGKGSWGDIYARRIV
jgi:FkbM family methyltransferase